MKAEDFIPQYGGATIVSISCCCIVGLWVIYQAFYRRYAAPGPPRLPILGNLLQLPSQLQFIQFTKWAEEYGPPSLC
ncbi:hypothetical protein BC629DRAFT_1055962 [Irpex lacteus]|nr:hypothetical protein BC629DRAFT_1055962 [Irpex lacteus]